MKALCFFPLMTLIILFVGGCKGKQKVSTMHTLSSWDSIRVERRDSMKYTLLNTSLSRQHLSVRKVEFLLPDSLSRQFIRSVILVEQRTENQTKDNEILTHQMMEQEDSIISYTEQQTETLVSGRMIHLRPFILLFLLLTIVLFIKIRKLWL